MNFAKKSRGILSIYVQISIGFAYTVIGSAKLPNNN